MEQAMNDEYLQLLECRFWPGTWRRPCTVFTFEVLQQFQQLCTKCGTNVHDFIKYLAAATDDFPEDVTVSCV